jgi:hypothetical protein
MAEQFNSTIYITLDVELWEKYKEGKVRHRFSYFFLLGI